MNATRNAGSGSIFIFLLIVLGSNHFFFLYYLITFAYLHLFLLLLYELIVCTSRHPSYASGAVISLEHMQPGLGYFFCFFDFFFIEEIKWMEADEGEEDWAGRNTF